LINGAAAFGCTCSVFLIGTVTGSCHCYGTINNCLCIIQDCS